jgi:hypothetical protein
MGDAENVGRNERERYWADAQFREAERSRARPSDFNRSQSSPNRTLLDRKRRCHAWRVQACVRGAPGWHIGPTVAQLDYQSLVPPLLSLGHTRFSWLPLPSL